MIAIFQPPPIEIVAVAVDNSLDFTADDPVVRITIHAAYHEMAFAVDRIDSCPFRPGQFMKVDTIHGLSHGRIQVDSSAAIHNEGTNGS